MTEKKIQSIEKRMTLLRKKLAKLGPEYHRLMNERAKSKQFDKEFGSQGIRIG